MPITFTYRQMGADGKSYPVDKDGNRIFEELQLTDEEWAACVNNPDSENYDEFAFNPYLREWGEGE